MTKPAITISNVTKQFKNQLALNDVSFTISQGAFHAICGENGSGKTTIIKIIIGSYSSKRYSGFITFADNIKISYVPESAYFPRGKTVYQYLLAIAKLLYSDDNEASVKVNTALKEMGILQLAKKYPNRFSSGQKKKVALSRIAIENTDVIILDEPSANLDFSSREFLDEKLAAWNKAGKTIVIVSHLVKEIAKYVNEVTLLHYGEMIVNKRIAHNELERVYSDELTNYAKKQKKVANG